MVLPEGTQSEEGRPRRSRAILIVLALSSVAVGVVALGAMTSPEPEAMPTPSTTDRAPATSSTATTVDDALRLVDVDTFSVEEIETGYQLDWERVAGFGDSFARALVEHDGWLYLFGAPTPAWAPEPGGLAGWRSRDGTEWESLGNVLGYEVEVMSVAATGQGLVALERSQDSTGFNIWLSGDGVAWEPRWVPTDGGEPHVIAYPQGVYGDSDKLVVVATSQLDTEGLIEEHLQAEGQDIDLDLSRGWGTDFAEDGVQLVVYGPLGIPIIEIGAKELGLTEEEATLLRNGFTDETDAAGVWVSERGGPWARGEIQDAQWIQSVSKAPGGELLMFGFGASGERTWRSIDGIDWEELSTNRNPSAATLWGDILVGQGNSAEILVSEDAETWEEAGLRPHLPAPINWHVAWITSGTKGIAAIVEGWSQSRTEPQRPNLPTLSDDDAVLRLDFDSGHFEMEVGDEVLSWRMFSEPVGNIEVDLSEQVVIFLHPDSGEELGRFRFDDLEDAEEEYWVGSFATQQFHAVAFSEDARTWAIQGVVDEFGEDSRVTQLEMTDGRLVAVVANSTDLYSRRPIAGFEVWTAPLP